MTSERAYEIFIIKINENATTDNVGCDKGRFSTYYNINENRLIESILDKRGEDEIRYLQKLLVDDVKIKNGDTHLDHQDFELPKNYFDLSNIYGLASKDKCINQKIDLYEIKDENRNQVLSDEFSKPSFKFREAPYSIASDKVKVYTNKEFDMSGIVMSYYRYPQKIELEDLSNPESNFKTNPELDDKFVNRVIDLTVSDFLLSQSDARYQALKVNAATKL